MCGIYAAISASDSAALSEKLRRRLCSRGPDHLGSHETRCSSREGRDFSLSFTSTVLALRGDHVAAQPFVDELTGSVFCWNGEAWKIHYNPRDETDGVPGNDGEAIFARLTAVLHVDEAARREAILTILRSIEGPFAFVFFDKVSGILYFGRDRLGRRSLLVQKDPSADQVVLSSVADSASALWTEVEADGIYQIDLGLRATGGGVHHLSTGITRLPWLEDDGDAAEFVSNIGRFNTSLPSHGFVLCPGAPSIKALKARLDESLRLRVLNVPKPPAVATPETNTRVAILFSGGLDCTVLARLCNDLLPSNQGIDLINVAFENPRVKANASKLLGEVAGTATNFYETCPDRITGRKSFAELKNICTARLWRFVAVDVPYEEYQSHKGEVISLMFPHNTEMDLSIACALHFAARGRGMAYTDNGPAADLNYTTPSRVLLSGLGADELFGGYSRHPAAYSARGYAGLVDELNLDISRLGRRNLGRDDRVMAHWGREVRFPYLDEELIRWAISAPVWEKCDFEHPDGVVEPGKRVLRLLALELGMAVVAGEKKRAIQFGSRTAKMESGRTKGTTLIS